MEEEVLQGHLRRVGLRRGGRLGEHPQLDPLGEGFEVDHGILVEKLVRLGPGDGAGPHLGGGRGQQLLAGAVVNQGAVLHQEDLVGDVLHIGDDVGGQQDQAVFRQLADEVAEADALLGVQTGGGLVQDENFGVVEHGLGDARPALHAAGELFHFLPPDLGEPHLLQQALHPLPGGGRAQALDGGDIEQIVLDREVGVVAKVLGQIPQQISIGAAQGEDVLPVPGDGPRGGGEEGAEHPHEGGFAGAVDAQQAVDTGVHGVGQVVYGGKG